MIELEMQGSQPPFISVIVCTRNRGPALADMLQSLVLMEQPEGISWELIVVDNGSTDDTPAMIESFADKLPLRSVREERAGLSCARNRGVDEARGAYLVWTDDDVRVDRRWLAAYAEAFHMHPDAAYFGGRINPVFEGRAPQWLTDNLDELGSAFARRELGDTMRPFTERQGDSPFGANFAVRLKDQREVAYPENLGVSPKFRRVGEETAVLRALRAKGLRGVWVPDASVDHIIPPARQSLDYVISYRKAAGETWAVLAEQPGSDNFMGPPLAGGSRLAGVPLWIWRMVLKTWTKYRLARLFGDSSRWMPRLMEYAYFRGAFDYLRKAPS